MKITNGEFPEPNLNSTVRALLERNNDRIISWILNTVVEHIGNNLNFIHSASKLWLKLEELYAQIDSHRSYQLSNDIVQLKQTECTIKVYYQKIKGLWGGHSCHLSELTPVYTLNGEGLRKSILSGPYVPSTVLVQAVAATEGVLAVQQHTTIETVLNMTPENKEHFLSEKEAIFLLLTGIGDEIYSTVDACKTANEMWIAIERLQQGESLNVQDVKTNLFWEFGKFTSREGESMESYYSRFANKPTLSLQ
ncbi:hypothetical protein Tco_1474494 [Tanacetum coccineum]